MGDKDGDDLCDPGDDDDPKIRDEFLSEPAGEAVATVLSNSSHAFCTFMYVGSANRLQNLSRFSSDLINARVNTGVRLIRGFCLIRPGDRDSEVTLKPWGLL
jgi:hypothetical protein